MSIPERLIGRGAEERERLGSDFDITNFRFHVPSPEFSLPGSNVIEPACIFGIFTANDVEEQSLQFGRDRAATACADGAVIQFANRRHFGCGAGKERLIRAIHFVTRDTLFDQLDTKIFCSAMMESRVIPSKQEVRSGV